MPTNSRKNELHIFQKKPSVSSDFNVDFIPCTKELNHMIYLTKVSRPNK